MCASHRVFCLAVTSVLYQTDAHLFDIIRALVSSKTSHFRIVRLRTYSSSDRFRPSSTGLLLAELVHVALSRRHAERV